jgi:hypothetical protein
MKKRLFLLNSTLRNYCSCSLYVRFLFPYVRFPIRIVTLLLLLISVTIPLLERSYPIARPSKNIFRVLSKNHILFFQYNQCSVIVNLVCPFTASSLARPPIGKVKDGVVCPKFKFATTGICAISLFVFIILVSNSSLI